MTRYYEFTKRSVGTSEPKKILIKLESIRYIEEDENIKYAEEKDVALIHGIPIKEKYEDIKKILAAEDRIIIYDSNTDFRIRELVRMGGISGIYSTYGKLATSIIKEICTAEDSDEIYKIQKHYIQKLKGK